MNEITNPVGRPRVITPEKIDKLEFAFAHGATDLQACFYAGISKSTFYDYLQENPDFSERKEALKNAITLRAKLNVAEKINDGDVGQSQWWLERKAKDEFSTRSENVNANINLNSEMTDEEKEKIKAILHANTQSRSGENPS